jgi:hypothetical protein
MGNDNELWEMSENLSHRIEIIECHIYYFAEFEGHEILNGMKYNKIIIT